MRRLSLVLVVSVLAAPLGCNRPDASASADVVRSDSAGVRIVTSTAEDRPLSWTFEDVGQMRDSTGEPFLFEGLSSRHVITDRAGRAYVLTREPSIVRFGRDGVLNRTFGRKGSGPGEMELPIALLVQGDSVVALDVMRSTLVRFGPDLAPIAEIPLRDGLADVTSIAFRVGGLWLQRSEFVDGAYQIGLYGDSARTAPLLSLPGTATTQATGCGGRIRISLPPLFTPEIHWATDRGRMLASRGPAFDLHLYDGARLSAVVRRTVPTRAPTVEDVPRLYPNGFKVQVSSGAECEFPLEQLTEQVGMAAQLPLVHGVMLLSDGTIWAQRSLRGEFPEVVDVFGSDGAYVGTLTGMPLPLGLLPNGEMLFGRRDEDSGGQHLVRYRVTR
jgi:hypothetical protein